MPGTHGSRVGSYGSRGRTPRSGRRGSWAGRHSGPSLAHSRPRAQGCSCKLRATVSECHPSRTGHGKHPRYFSATFPLCHGCGHPREGPSFPPPAWLPLTEEPEGASALGCSRDAVPHGALPSSLQRGKPAPTTTGGAGGPGGWGWSSRQACWAQPLRAGSRL